MNKRNKYIPPLRWGRELCDMTIPQADEIKLRCEAHADLLAACKAIADTWEADEIGQIDEAVIELARAAISKAETGVSE